jgi:glycosyltransferase involved in cell wall biosynthesis
MYSLSIKHATVSHRLARLNDESRARDAGNLVSPDPFCGPDAVCCPDTIAGPEPLLATGRDEPPRRTAATTSTSEQTVSNKPLRIGILLRHLGQHGGGVRVYTQNLLQELVRIDTPHEFVFFYSDPAFKGSFASAPNVREVVATAPSVLIWDQLVARRLAARARVDLLFNPKYSIPLGGNCPSAWVCHGLDWYAMPWGSRWMDRLSHQFLVPLYARKADQILCVSETTREHLHEYLEVPAQRTRTVYLGVDEAFREALPESQLAAARSAYRLPERFVLYCGQIYPAKNFRRLVQAYARIGPAHGVRLVIAGEHRWLAEDDLAEIERLGISDWVHWPGWIDRKSLPAFYQLAEALLLPSLYEACGIPLLEAMASRCPVVTSNVHGCREIAGDAGILVDPTDVAAIAEGIRLAITDRELCRKKIALGVERSQQFSWQRCASETLAALESIIAGPPARRPHAAAA